ncbi:MAG: hypothetical protein DRJ09_00620 [Bacteroidetes bacterium]|nr:MAG: hypothetical protein DRJ09_00620 [Bacteroidota bacterium]
MVLLKIERLKRLLFIVGLLFFNLVLFAQKKELKKTRLKDGYHYLLGNIGFAVDSSDFFIGDVQSGTQHTYQLKMYNYGTEEIVFTPGKSSQLISVTYDNTILYPHTEGVANIHFNASRELPAGPVQLEVVIETNDELNPWKFLYMNTKIIKTGGVEIGRTHYIDTVPRIVFSHYNFEYGHKILNGRVRHDFMFSNMGSKELVIKKIELCNGCILKGEPNQVIHPGESGSLVLVIKTKGIGVAHRSVKVYTNDPVNPVIYLGIHGTVTFNSPAKKDPAFCKESF